MKCMFHGYFYRIVIHLETTYFIDKVLINYIHYFFSKTS